ncbi:MAG: methyltransferase domain-containing protein, partial [Eudoraea sp.]|nr:methyltransferase domain-containing protein [Eudoraea sp.]
DYVSTDLNSPLASVKADLRNLPFENDTFDVILCNHVLEHIPDDEAAMKELYRVMKPGGWGVFQIPQDIYREKTFEDNSITDKAERTRIFGQYDHVRIYGLDYFDRLKEVGFEAEGINYTADFVPEDIERYGLAEGELIPLVRKN